MLTLFLILAVLLNIPAAIEFVKAVGKRRAQKRSAAG